MIFILTVIFIVILLLTVGITIFLIHNIKVTLHYVTGTHGIEKTVRARKTKDGDLEFIKIFNSTLRFPMPPPNAISLNGKGKYVLHVEINEQGQHRYMVKNHTGEFLGLTTNDRIFMTEQYRRAQERKGKSLSEIFLQLAPFMFIIILVVLTFIYWSDIIEPAKEVAKLNVENTANQKEIANQNARMLAILSELAGRGQFFVEPLTNKTEVKPPND